MTAQRLARYKHFSDYELILVWFREKITGFAIRYLLGCDFGQVAESLRSYLPPL